jgi:hypothetical protein
MFWGATRYEIRIGAICPYGLPKIGVGKACSNFAIPAFTIVRLFRTTLYRGISRGLCA